MPEKKQSKTLASTPEGILHLNQQQLFYFFVGLLLIGGLIFALGIMTGKRMVSIAQDGAEELEKLDLQAKIQEKARAATATQSEKKEEEKATESEKKPETKEDAKAGNKETEKPPEAPEKKQSPPPEEKNAEEKRAAKEAPKRISTPNQPPPSKEYDPQGIWTLQVGSVATKEQADKMTAHLKEKGYKVNVSSAEIEGKGTFYRIRVGRFTTKEDAALFQKKYEDEEKTQTMISRF
ncbi:MAG: hypothetical protein Kow0090_20950 [Myxococcota bacterium]